MNTSEPLTLFLDRDGVINHRWIDDYVKSWEQFRFLDGVLDAFRIFNDHFDRIIVVTNQQGIGRKIMTVEALNEIHGNMAGEIAKAGGRIDKIYFCPDLRNSGSFYRKPQVGMALQAKHDFSNINFHRSFMAGDSLSDMQFGKRLKMKTILIAADHNIPRKYPSLVDYRYASLIEFAQAL